MIAGKRIFLDDAELSGLLREERKYNEGLRKRRAARLLILYEKNR